jgi:CheY-like chemotaxis protein
MAKKILLAEDSVTMQKVVEMTFAAEGFTVTAVSTAEGAIQQAKEIKPDVVIADLSMEGKNGYDVCSAVKGDPSLAGTAVLLLHGSSAPYDTARGKAARADGDIAKPFETQALIDKVKALAESVPAAKEQPIGPIESLAAPMGAGDIVIDTESLAEAAKPAAAKPAPKPVAPKPVVAPPQPAPKPAVAKPAPVAPKPTPPRPAPKPVAPPKPAVAAPKPPTPAPVVAKAEPGPVEITIEAEPPPLGGGGVVNWDKFDVPGFDEPPRTDATLLGVGQPTPTPAPAVAKTELPTPPPGMPLPPAAKAPPPLQPGQPYEPAVYEAITKLSREVIERIVWEVVPDLAEQIIREELDRLVEKRRSG